MPLASRSGATRRFGVAAGGETEPNAWCQEENGESTGGRFPGDVRALRGGCVSWEGLLVKRKSAQGGCLGTSRR